MKHNNLLPTARLLLQLMLIIFTPAVYAMDVALDLTLTSAAEQVTATVNNRSDQSVAITDFQLELNRRHYTIAAADQLAPHSKRTYRLSVAMPELPGSYLIGSRLHYRNGDRWLTLQNVGIFYVEQRDEISAACRFDGTTIRKNRRRLTLQADESLHWRVFIPDELLLQKPPDAQHEQSYRLREPVPGFIDRYTVYAGAERIVEGRHQAALCSAPLTVDGQFSHYRRGRISDLLLYITVAGTALGVLLITGANSRNKPSEEKFFPYAGYFSRLFFIGSAYIVLRHLPSWLDVLNTRQWLWLNDFSDHFWGDTYRFFFEYFADAYFLAYALLGLPYFLFFYPPNAQKDKYQALLLSLFSIPRLLALRRPHWNNLSRLGALTLSVKIFFLPYMISWSIQNIRHIGYLIDTGLSGFGPMNDLVQTVFMLLDTGIFAFGYLVESRRLGSEIRSVDATFSGWLVCLWCYPPFNNFSFRYFDYPLFDIHIQTSAVFQTCMAAAVTGLWGIFCIASINLGFKASNMTNRGIVTHGLYRYVRHPAYACKILAWLIQGIFLGQYTLGILLAFTVIYGLRALTEERHLSLDSDYLAYKSQVPWRFVPGVL